MSKRGKITRKKKNTQLETGAEQSEECEEIYAMMSPYLRIFEARRILSGQSMPTKFKFRSSQIESIQININKFLGKEKHTGSRVIMITGSPGAGKTLSTNFVLRRSPYQVIALNSNIIKKKKDVQRILAEKILEQELEEKDLTTYKIISHLEKLKNPKPCILYIEEVELFFNSTKEFLSEDFFTLFSHRNLKIMLIGISNTIDALEKYGPKLNITTSDITNIVFNPYTIEEIKEIMRDKFDLIHKKTGINLKITDKLLRYTANKLSDAKKGDMRMTFEFLRALSNLVLPLNQKMEKELPDQIEIDIQKVQEADKRMRAQKQKLIHTIPFQQQIILIALYQCVIRDDPIFVFEDQIKKETKKIYDRLFINPKKELVQELSDLEVYGFIENKVNAKLGKARYMIKVSLEEIKSAFETNQLLRPFFIENL